MVQMAFFDLSHTYHKQVINVSPACFCHPTVVIFSCVGYLLLLVLWSYKFMRNVLMLKRSPSSSPVKADVIVCSSVCRSSSQERPVFTPVHSSTQREK